MQATYDLKSRFFPSQRSHFGRSLLSRGRVATVREKYLENETFSRSGNFVDGLGNLERTWKVREFENKWLWQAVFRKFIYSV